MPRRPPSRRARRSVAAALALGLLALALVVVTGRDAGNAAPPSAVPHPAAATTAEGGGGSAPAPGPLPGVQATVGSVPTPAGPRAFVAITPADPAPALPLIVVLHGRGQSIDTAIASTGFVPLARRGQADLLYPEGLGRSWDAGYGCCGPSGHAGVDDQAFVVAAVREARHLTHSDPARTYLAGYSNGGKLAYALSCAPTRTFDAVATYGSVPLAPCPASSRPPPTPFLLAAGTDDQVLPFDGRRSGAPPLPAVPTAVSWLRARNGVGPTPTVVVGARSRSTTWSRPGGPPVTEVVFPGQPHTWPVTGPPGSTMADLAWAFFRGAPTT